MPEMNWSKFAGMVAAFDDTEEGNGQAALHMLRSILKTRGMKFVEAIESEEYKKCIWEKLRPEGLREFMAWKRNGGNRNDADSARLRGRITQLESELAETQRSLTERERGGAELARALKDQEGVISALRRELKTVRDRVGSERNIHDVEREVEKVRAEFARALLDKDEVIAALRDEMKQVWERARSKFIGVRNCLMEKERINDELRAEIKRMNESVGLCRGCEVKLRTLATIGGFLILFFWSKYSPWQDSSAQANLCKVLLAASPLLAVFSRWQWILFKRRHSWISAGDNDIFRAITAKWNGFLRRLTLKN